MQYYLVAYHHKSRRAEARKVRNHPFSKIHSVLKRIVVADIFTRSEKLFANQRKITKNSTTIGYFIRKENPKWSINRKGDDMWAHSQDFKTIVRIRRLDV